jgi:putative oxidoreductase
VPYRDQRWLIPAAVPSGAAEPNLLRRDILAVGLLIIHVVLGLLLVGHGAQQLRGSFGGHGLSGTEVFLDSVGYRSGRRMAVLAGLAEVTGGALLALGLLTPLSAAIDVGTMFAAGAAHTSNELWCSNGGCEEPLFYAVTALGLGFTGPGSVPLTTCRAWAGRGRSGVRRGARPCSLDWPNHGATAPRHGIDPRGGRVFGGSTRHANRCLIAYYGAAAMIGRGNGAFTTYRR